MTLLPCVLRAVCLLSLAIAPAVQALDIVVSNDDGFETANIRALKTQLVAAGHRVVIAAPTRNQSGQSGRVDFLKPLGPLTRATRFGTVKAGAPGIGVDPLDANVAYVDGSPVMATMYALDVLARKKWGRLPDLVISGPNEGHNLGPGVNSSGTVANALFALNRGITALAVSNDEPAASYPQLRPDDSHYRTANLVVQIVRALERQRRGDEPLLPAGTGLNVNVPRVTSTCTPAGFSFTRLGTARNLQFVFFEDISTSAYARAAGIDTHLPGVSLVSPTQTLPQGIVLPPPDHRDDSEGNAIHACTVTLSVLQSVPQASTTLEAQAQAKLRALVHAERRPHP